VVRNLLHSFLPDDHPPLPIPNCVIYCLSFDPRDQSWEVTGPLE
jgi:hypothetical protein